jgi:hypothetical protein
MNRTFCPIPFTSFSPKRKNTVLLWTFKLNNALDVANTRHLKEWPIKVNDNNADLNLEGNYTES